MLNNIEKKIKIKVWRLRLLENMQHILKIYKFTNNEEDLKFAKELGRDSEKLHEILEGLH